MCFVTVLFSWEANLIIGTFIGYSPTVVTLGAIAAADRVAQIRLRRNSAWSDSFVHRVLAEGGEGLSATLSGRPLIVLVGIALAWMPGLAVSSVGLNGFMLLGLGIGFLCGMADVTAWVRGAVAWHRHGMDEP